MIDGEVKIIDEFTGRILEGRRWSEGLHQAVEAKEGVGIREENQTLATITLQNYFRMYDKLAGMTGTALTEANEFIKIYKLPVVDIPTNQADGPRRPQRPDLQDQGRQVGRGRAARSRSATSAGSRCSSAPSRSRSRRCSPTSLRKQGVKHVVLNAKPEHAQHEGETIAEAGPPRRGHDRDQHGRPRRGHHARRQRGAPDARWSFASSASSPATTPTTRPTSRSSPKIKEQVEADHEKVKELGGLFILGTERHESRRIDNQLRGRAGRQGDPGESRFYLSAEDDLVRLFAGDRIYRILDRLGPVDEDGREQPIEAKMLSRTIENAQKKVEEQNFLIRKRVLEYDDVLNQQREVIYKYRREILEGRDMSEPAKDELRAVFERIVEEYTPGDFVEEWDIDELFVQVAQIFDAQLRPGGHRRGGARSRGADGAAVRGRAAPLRRARAGARRRS